MRILILCSEGYDDSTSGIGVIVANTIRCLNNIKGINIGLGVFRVLPNEGVSQFKNSLDAEIRLLVKAKPLSTLGIIRGMFNIHSIQEQKMLDMVFEVSKDYDIALWFGSGYDPISLSLPNYCKCPIIFHISDSLYLYQLLDNKRRFNFLRKILALLQEKRVLRAGYSRIIYVANEDRRIAIQLATPLYQANIACLPNGVDVEHYTPSTKDNRKRECVVILFTGVLSYPPNVDAALFLINEIMPNVLSNVELRFVGRDPHIKIKEASTKDRRIRVIGTVLDMVNEHHEADIFIAPMISGAGIKNKILQAMSCALPVIATSSCVKAFSVIPAGIIVGDTPSELFTAIDVLAKDPVARKKIGMEGRNFVVNNCSWLERTHTLIHICEDAQVERI